MPATQPQPHSPGSQRAGRTDFRNLQRRLSEAVESDTPPADRLRAALAVLLDAVTARGVLLFDCPESAAPVIVEEIWQRDDPDANAQRAAAACAAQAMTQGQASVSAFRGEGGLQVVAVPVHAAGGIPRQCLCVLAGREPHQAPEALVLLSQTVAEALHAHTLKTGLVRATALVELLDRASGADDYPRALQRLAEELRAHLGCHRVCLGDRRSAGIRIGAVSGEPGFDRRSAKALAIETAMNAAVRLRVPLATPAFPGETTPSHALDEAAAALDAAHAIAAPLLSHDGEAVGAWLIAWKEQPDPAATTFLEASAPHLGPFLRILRRGKPGRILGPLERAWREASKDKRRLATGMAAALGVVLLVPFPYRIAADAKLQPVSYRIVAAPFDGILRQSHVEPGTVVREGQLLAELDGKEIRWQLAEAVAQRARALKQRDTAMAQGAAAAAQAASLEAASFDAQVELLEHRRDNLRVLAPVDGIVLTGDLERAQGVPVGVGQRLFEIAPLDRMLTEIAVPQREVSRVKEGRRVGLRLESDPGETFTTKVDRVRPRSEQIDGENVFVAEAYLENEDGSLRPGMRGEAKIRGPWRPLAWIVFHRLWEFVQLRIW